MNNISAEDVANASSFIISPTYFATVSGSDPTEALQPDVSEYGNPTKLMEPWAYTASAITLFFIGFFGFFLNLLVIVLMCKNAQLWTPMNIILFNLVCSDFSVSFIGTPFTLVSAIAHHWIFNREMCVTYGFFMSLLGITSITSLTVLSYERFCLISQPFSARNPTRRGAVLAILFIWSYSFALTSPPLFGWGAYVMEAADISCSVNWESQTTNAMTYIVFLFIFGLIVPLIVIIYSYANIVIKLKRNSARMGRTNRAETRVTSMVALMVIAFMIAWTPYSVFALLEQFGPSEAVTPAMAVLPALIAKSSICYNPIIYVGMNTQFRAAFKRVRNNDSQDNNTTTNHQDPLTNTSKELTECSFRLCRKRQRLKLMLRRDKFCHAPIGGERSSSTNMGAEMSCHQVHSMLNTNATSDSIAVSNSARNVIRPDFELSVINTGKSILIKTNTFRSNLV
ncbi:vertebrate ancient opsin-like [Toxorhynchites rutilus septentrionalis]|uniref:vertebrate ancient opsin-like n=1 Tax=Toxorhynchites rutilus septentrionalis TaxID=329112 RepID=UPI00247A6165|nr:vertebrate ancient opsin-like [Toxorhynchites rutilus septentrionalis]